MRLKQVEFNFKNDSKKPIHKTEMNSDFEIKLEIRATIFSVQSVDFAFVCNNFFDDFEVIPYDEPITYTRSGEAFKNYSNGERKYINAIIRTLYRS